MRADSALPTGPGMNYAIDDPFTSARLSWWRNGRFGMFIHFGVYSHLEGEFTRPDGTVCQDAEWILDRCDIPRAEYEGIARVWPSDHFGVVSDIVLAPRA